MIPCSLVDTNISKEPVTSIFRVEKCFESVDSAAMKEHTAMEDTFSVQSVPGDIQ
jgi:hypothetical protein